jgi:carbonic anhydrase
MYAYMQVMSAPPHPDALVALKRLREGNGRFANQVMSIEALASMSRRQQLLADQRPSAIVLGCSDSRAPAEMVFDQGLGDLFVIRLAGNVVAPSGVGSVEFAAERFGTRLVVVMGHTRCGAVQAALEPDPVGVTRTALSIVGRVRPAIETVRATLYGLDKETMLYEAVKANVRAQAAALRQGSSLMERLILEEGLIVVGAVYELETGKVDFFDGMPRGTTVEIAIPGVSPTLVD